MSLNLTNVNLGNVKLKTIFSPVWNYAQKPVGYEAVRLWDGDTNGDTNGNHMVVSTGLASGIVPPELAMYSTDAGETWNVCNTPARTSRYSSNIQYFNGTWYMGYWNAAGTELYGATSSDGITFTDIVPGTPTLIESPIIGVGGGYAAGWINELEQARFTQDGVNFTLSDSMTPLFDDPSAIATRYSTTFAWVEDLQAWVIGFVQYDAGWNYPISTQWVKTTDRQTFQRIQGNFPLGVEPWGHISRVPAGMPLVVTVYGDASNVNNINWNVLRIYASFNLANWQVVYDNPNAVPGGQGLPAMAYGENNVVMAAGQGIIAKSEYGLNWEDSTNMPLYSGNSNLHIIDRRAIYTYYGTTQPAAIWTNI